MLPTTIFTNGSPLQCQECFHNDFAVGNYCRSSNPSNEKSGFNSKYVLKQCTLDADAVHRFWFYFPYIILSMSLALMLIEHIFDKIFKTEVEQTTLYDLLVQKAILARGEYFVT